MLYDVLIIGAGCTGVMTARLLSAKNVKVAVAEAHDLLPPIESNPGCAD